MKGPTKVTVAGGIPKFQTIIETAQGGFTLAETVLPAGTIIPAGTVIGYDETTRLAMVAKYGVLQANALNSDTTYRFLKGSNLAVGQTINLPGGTPRAITAIDKTTFPAYDAVTVGTTIGVAANAGIAASVNDNGINLAKGLLKNDRDVSSNEDLAVVIRGTVYERRIAPVSDAVKALMPTIIFSKSY